MLYENELKLLEIVWNKEEITASEIVKVMKEKYAWKKSTTYTVINKCINKGYITRGDSFTCKSMITKADALHENISNTLTNLFEGSAVRFFSAFTNSHRLTVEEKNEIKKMIDDLE